MACRLMTKLFIFGGRPSISQILLLMREVCSTKVPLGARVDWYKATSACISGFTDLLRRKFVCQVLTNRSERKGLVQLDTMIVRRGIGVVSPKTELPQPRLQSSTWFLKVPLRNRIAVRYFHGGRATALVAFPARIPTSPRSLLSTAVTNESWSRRVPGGRRWEW